MMSSMMFSMMSSPYSAYVPTLNVKKRAESQSGAMGSGAKKRHRRKMRKQRLEENQVNGQRSKRISYAICSPLDL